MSWILPRKEGREPWLLHLKPSEVGLHGPLGEFWNSVSPLHMQVPHRERIRKSNLFANPKLPEVSNSVGHVALYCDKFIILFTETIHKKQTWKIKKIFWILQYSALKSAVVQYNSWTGAGIEWTDKDSCWVGRGGGRWQSWRMVSSGRRRASCSVSRVWRWSHRFWFLSGIRCTVTSLRVCNLKVCTRGLTVELANSSRDGS